MVPVAAVPDHHPREVHARLFEDVLLSQPRGLGHRGMGRDRDARGAVGVGSHLEQLAVEVGDAQPVGRALDDAGPGARTLDAPLDVEEGPHEIPLGVLEPVCGRRLVLLHFPASVSLGYRILYDASTPKNSAPARIQGNPFQ